MLGHLNKLKVIYHCSEVSYFLSLENKQGRHKISLNGDIGKTISMKFTGNIYCLQCGTLTKKSLSQGHCYICSQKLASCDMCILKPELCHFDRGTCREPIWAQSHCFQPHIVYLSYTSGLKVGITRESQVPTRWIDQGATQALAIIKVSDRKTAGCIEKILSQSVADKTNWRTMLKGNGEGVDLQVEAKTLLNRHRDELNHFSYEIVAESELTIKYPVESFPEKITTFDFDKSPELQAKLIGIKGQYLIFENNTVINIRKFGGYEIEYTK